MERYFGEDEELPSILQITRKDFSDEAFAVDDFLTRFHQFQTLEDLQKQLKSWDKVLSHELIDVINEDYGDFVGLGNSLSGGESKIQDIKMDILRFQGETRKVKNELDKTIENSNKLLETKNQLSILQDLAREMLLYLKKINNLENYLRLDNHTIANIINYGKLFIEIKLLSRDINLRMNKRDNNIIDKDYLIIEETLPKLNNLKNEIISLIDTEIRNKSSTNDEILKLAIVKRKLLEI